MRACRADGIDTEKIDDSATTMARAYSKISGGKTCFIPLVWDTVLNLLFQRKLSKGWGFILKN